LVTNLSTEPGPGQERTIRLNVAQKQEAVGLGKEENPLPLGEKHLEEVHLPST